MSLEWELDRWRRPAMLGALILTLVLSAGCKRRTIVDADEPTAPASEAAQGGTGESRADAVAVGAGHFLDPLLGVPWLGHADDGALISVEFFVSENGASALTRTNITHVSGGVPTMQSPFSATSDLAVITWDDGESRAAFDAAAKSLDASIASNAGTHRVTLRQISAANHPGLASFRTSVPEDAETLAEYQEFSTTLETGNRWWKSVDDWGRLVAPQEIVATGNHLALIRPADRTPPIVPELEPGGHFDIPVECRLSPGSSLAEADSTVGVVAELHSSGNVQATWVLTALNPGAVEQTIDAHWLIRPGDPIPTGVASLYVYLAESRVQDGGGDGEGTRATELAKPISNLLEIEIEFVPAGGTGTTP